jgi:hypothetical protein
MSPRVQNSPVPPTQGLPAGRNEPPGGEGEFIRVPGWRIAVMALCAVLLAAIFVVTLAITLEATAVYGALTP